MPPRRGFQADARLPAVRPETDQRLPVSGFSTPTKPMKDVPDLHARCSRLVEQANQLSAPTHDIWQGLPADLALQLAVQLSEIHTNALSVIAWFANHQLIRPDETSPLFQIGTYVDEAERFVETLARVG
jgi:hypothetical protein